MRGEFIRCDGLVIPNNISKAGAALILAGTLRNEIPPIFAALVGGTPTPAMKFGDMTEPTIGTNGYARIAIANSPLGWPETGVAGDEVYIESLTLTWTATGAGFSQPIQRLALGGFSAYNAAHEVYALSAPLPAALTILPATPLVERQFKYRIYL